ncbi:MauE/DoxX family redox-associated membrane protein [Nonomuraea sp. B10E15]|uniref:MauE/DoxX family redox-associated membrane protein n=1 Tax=Nonomuraea sp. B10E15 TaxID=3153560 RepID=UPI00325F0A3D
MIAYIGFGCRLLLAVVFLVAVAGKLFRRRNLTEFRSSLAAFGVRPRWRPAVTAGVAGGELAAAALLPVEVTALAGLAIGAALLIAFTSAIAVALRRGTPADCRCFGGSARPLGLRHLVRNAILLSIAACGTAGTVLATNPGAAGWDAVALLLSGSVALFLAAMLIAYDDLVSLVLAR